MTCTSLSRTRPPGAGDTDGQADLCGGRCPAGRLLGGAPVRAHPHRLLVPAPHEARRGARPAAGAAPRAASAPAPAVPGQVPWLLRQTNCPCSPEVRGGGEGLGPRSVGRELLHQEGRWWGTLEALTFVCP